MLYSEDELKTMMKRLDGSASPYPKVSYNYESPGFSDPIMTRDKLFYAIKSAQPV